MATALHNRYQINKILIKILLILSVIAWFVYPLGDIQTLTIIKFPTAFVIVWLIILNYRHATIKFRLPLAVLTLLLIYGLLQCSEPITLEMIVGLTYFILSIFLIIISDTLKFDKSIIGFIYFCSLISICISTYYAYSPIAYWTGKTFISYLTLGLYNSNFTGILLFAIGAVFIVSCPKQKWYYRLINYSIYAWNCYLIFETNCRSALAAAIFVPLASIFLLKFKIKKFLIFAILLLPVIFVPFYMNFADNADEEVTEEVVMGKGLVSGRQRVYHEYIDNVTFHDFVLGKLGGSGVPNAHNAPLSILAAFGLSGFIAYGYILTKKLLQDNEWAHNKNAKFGLYSVLACVIEGCGESALFSGSFPVFIYVFIFFALAGSDNYRQLPVKRLCAK